MIPRPTVRMIRHPPSPVPSVIAAPQPTRTASGVASAIGVSPDAAAQARREHDP
jgi:hypothetical protein